MTKPYTHTYCNLCKHQDTIADSPKNGLCPVCATPLVKLRKIIPVGAIGHDAGKQDSKGNGKKAITLPKKLTGKSNPSDLFLGIKESIK